MNRFNTLEVLNKLIQSESILTHPFYVAWERGELKRSQIATYATLYYRHVQAFPRYLESAIENTDNVYTRDELTQNLTDELSTPKAHHELWLDFAEELGLDRCTVFSTPAHSSAKAMDEVFNRLTKKNTSSALAALYSYEVQQPEVSNRKMAGLRKFYNLDSPKALAYFEVHATTDLKHSQAERGALARCLTDDVAANQIISAATQALDAYWKLLDGVCDATGISRS